MTTKSTRFELRLTPEEFARWNDTAESEGRTLAGWVRWVCGQYSAKSRGSKKSTRRAQKVSRGA